MPAVPLGMEAYSRTAASTPEVILKNLYIEEDKSGNSPDGYLRLQRPALTEMVSFPARIRGIFQMDGVLSDFIYVVAGDKLYSTDLASITEIGTVPDDGFDVAMAANRFKLGIVSNGQFFTYDGDTLSTVALPDDKAPVDLDVLNGYFLLPLSDGVFYWLSPDQDDFESADAILQYAEAESIPDGCHGVRRMRDEFFIFGTRNIEVWQATGLSDSTFERSMGRTIDKGVHSRETIRKFDNSVAFVGDDGFVYRLTDVPQRISTSGIEERIAQRSNTCSASVVSVSGHKFYVLHIPSQGSFAYDAATQAWCEFSTIGQSLWEASTSCETPELTLVGNSAGQLSKLDETATTDNGKAIERTISATVALPAQRVANSSLALYVGATAETVFSIRWKDALGDWSQPRAVAAREGYDILFLWRLGATKGAFRTFEISTTSESLVRISGALANEGRVTQ